MAKTQSSVQKLSPDQLVAGFSRNRLVQCFLVALVIHAVGISALSVGYIRDTWIDPKGAEARIAAAAAAKKAEEAAKNPPPPANTNAALGGGSGGAAGSQPASQPGGATGENDPRIPKALTEVAKPDEIPKVPGDDLDIKIEDTNK